MRQEITRAHKGWALDNVILDNEVTRMMKEDLHGPPNEGQYKRNNPYYYTVILSLKSGTHCSIAVVFIITGNKFSQN